MENQYIIIELTGEESGLVQDALLEAKVNCEKKAEEWMRKDQAIAESWKCAAEEFERLFFKFFKAKRK